MKRYRKLLTVGVFLLSVGVLLGMKLGTIVSGDNTLASLKKLENAFLVINQRYVHDVDSSVLVESAIRGMLQELDPHSVYIDSDRMRRVQEDFNAAFEGIGISYEIIGGRDGLDTVIVLSPLSGGPSETAGLMSGDRILAVNDSSAIGFSNEDVQSILRGPRGTSVTVTVRRPGYSGPLDFTITRDRIPIYTKDAHFMLDERTGYIRLNRFARTTYNEFTTAMRELKGLGMERLVLDLRGNSGGFMDQAVRISDEFLAEGDLIVEARGRLDEYNTRNVARSGDSFERGAVMVLVDEQSASASEIVAGALQDHDRALIVGRRTFGKGLVQKQYPLRDGSVLRVTISRFYTPSGRLIQTPYENGVRDDYYREKVAQSRRDRTLSIEEILDSVPDSLKFLTRSGRTVFGGGGILPDFLILPDSSSAFTRAVLRQSLDNDFARTWLDRAGDRFIREWEGRRDEFIDQFMISDEDYGSFLDFIAERGVRIVDEDGLELQGRTDAHFSRSVAMADRHFLQTRIKAHVAQRMFDRGAWFAVTRDVDTVLQKAMELWSSAEALAAR